MRRKSRTNDEAEINITPMLDIVFIMLIFFIVTTSFVKEKGLEVSRPSNSPPKEIKKNKGPILVKIDANGNITMKGRMLEAKAVQANLEREKAEKYYCKRAQEVYDSYLKAPRLYKTNDTGVREYLSDEESAQTLAETKARVEELCNI